MKASQRFVLGGLFFCASALAGPPHLVRDINTTIIPVHSIPGEFMDQGTWSFFTGSDGVHYRDVWGTDGTTGGTLKLDSNNTLPSNVSGYQTARAGGLTYFISSTTNLGHSLWATNGTPQGTRLIGDASSLDGGEPGLGGPIGSNFLFEARKNGATGVELWLTDGKASGTHLVKALDNLFTIPDADAFVDDKRYFLTQLADGTTEPWISDGTASGTQRLAQLPLATQQESGVMRLGQAGRFLLFAAATSDRGNELWRINRDTHAVTALPDIAPGAASGISDLAVFGMVGNFAVFPASAAGDDNVALWRTDGTTVSLIANVRPLQDEVNPFSKASPAGRLFFKGDDGVNGAQLWSTDGNTATRLTTGTTPGSTRLVGSNLLFIRSAPSGPEVWRTDGTLAGTRQLQGLPTDPFTYNVEFAGDANALFIRFKRLTPNVGFYWQVFRYELLTDAPTLIRTYSNAPNLTTEPFRVFEFTRGQLYFDSNEPVIGHEIWVSDGTTTGTRLLRNLAPETRTQPSSPDNFVEFDGKLYFGADDGIQGRELWRSDGTASGTQLVKDLNTGTDSSEPIYPFVSNGKLYFFAKQGSNPSVYKFFVSDGSAAGTVSLSELTAPTVGALGSGNCGARSVILNGSTFFEAYEPVAGLELWKTNGTSAGTALVADIAPGGLTAPCWLTVFAGRLYFSANGGVDQGTELWSTDGTASGTQRVADIRPGTNSSSPRELLVFNQSLYFFANDSTGNAQLWKSDGTSAGTVTVARFDAPQFGAPTGLSILNGALVFQVPGVNGSLSPQLWTSDGTTQGTVRVGDVLAFPAGLFVNAGHGYLTSKGPLNVFSDGEPWVTDGTASGTRLLMDINPLTGSNPAQFADFHGVTLFQANDGLPGGTKLWRTNGTAAQTTLIGDIGAAQTTPFTRLTASQSFFYVSDVDGSGAELFAVSNDAPLAGNDNGGSVEAGQSVLIAVLANDNDPDGALDASSVRVQTLPAHGTVAVSSSGTVTYTAQSGFAGTDSFTYVVDDNQAGRSTPALVTVTVTAPPPPATPPTTPNPPAAPTPPATPPTTPNPPAAPTPPADSGSGGGGALGPIELLFLLVVLAYLRNRYASVRRSELHPAPRLQQTQVRHAHPRRVRAGVAHRQLPRFCCWV